MKTLEDVHAAAVLAGRRTDHLRDAALAAASEPTCGWLYGVYLDVSLSTAARDAVAVEFRRRAAACEADLRDLGIGISEPAPTLRPPASWDEESGEFTFTVCTAQPTRSERGLGYTSVISVDQVILAAGHHQKGRRPAEIVSSNRTGGTTLGEVVRVWEEDGTVLGRGRLRPEASAARAAVASGAVADVAALIEIYGERVTQREGLRPLMTVTEWGLGGVMLASDDPGVGKLDPLPLKDEPVYEVEFKVGGGEVVKAKMKKTKVEAARRATSRAS